MIFELVLDQDGWDFAPGTDKSDVRNEWWSNKHLEVRDKKVQPFLTELRKEHSRGARIMIQIGERGFEYRMANRRGTIGLG